MVIDVITAFPGILRDPLDESILKQAKKRIDLQIHLHDLRSYSTNKHHTIDDAPYGGGPGMILGVEPLFLAVEDVIGQNQPLSNRRIIFPSPQGRLFDQALAEEFAGEEHLVFICGHYKGVDQRVIDTWVTDEVSVGDFVLSGGEIPALLMVDSIVRLIPGALHDIESARTDSFQDGLLDCPHYTRPEQFRDFRVPEVLLSGNHKKIDEWRREQRVARTGKGGRTCMNDTSHQWIDLKIRNRQIIKINNGFD